LPGSVTRFLPVSWHWKTKINAMKTVFHMPLFFLLAFALTSYAEQSEELNGREIMQEAYSRHQQYSYLYEEQSIVMRDRNGKRDTRKLHRYSRVEEDGTVKFLLVLDYPEEIRGVAVLATRNPSGSMTKSIYLPAFGEQLIESGGDSSYENFLGTDFSVEDILGEILTDYRYGRRQDRKIDDVQYFVIDVYRLDGEVRPTAPVRRHFVRQDNFFISKTDHYDKQGRLQKRQSHHDLRAVDVDMWCSGMILIEDVKERHQSLLKVTRRLFSRDYVPAEIFTPDWLYQNHPYIAPQEAVEDMVNDEDQSMSVEIDEELMQFDGEEMLQP